MSKNSIHRLSDGKVKVGRQSSRPKIANITSVKNIYPEKTGITCPTCQNKFELQLSGEESGKIQRICNSCLDTLEFDVRSSTTKTIKKSSDNPLLTSFDSEKFVCSGCTKEFTPYLNTSSATFTDYILCRQCNTVHQFPTQVVEVNTLTHKNPKKTRIKITCPNNNCKKNFSTDFISEFNDINRACPECTTAFKYSTKTSAIKILDYDPQVISSSDLNNPKIPCACGDSLPTQYVQTNSSGAKFLDCYRCGRITQVKED